LIIIHGGPGMAHNYVDNFKNLASNKRAVIHYDQLGCGQSTHLPDVPIEFWTVSLFLDELDNLLSYLNISQYDLLGQSWGGMLACEHAVKQPPGLRRLILASSPSDLPLGVIEVNKLRDQLPFEVQQTLLKHEQAGTTNHPEYQSAVRVFNSLHVCRIPPPAEVIATEAQYLADPTVYLAMWGPSEFYVIGTLKHWTIIDRLNRIIVPTLTYSGIYDEAAPRTQLPFLERITGNVQQVLFNESSHMPHIEEHEKTMSIIRDFLEN
jgi:L-proline amide hydrolase